MKAKKTTKVLGTGKGLSAGAEDADEAAVTLLEEDEDEAPKTKGGVEIIADLDETPKPVNIAAVIGDADNLEIVFLQEQMDYPVIGRFNFLEKFGCNRIRRHQKFVVPKNVALTLYDKGLVTIPGLE